MNGLACFRGARRWRVCMPTESRSVIDELLAECISSIRRKPIIAAEGRHAWRIEDAILSQGWPQTAHFDVRGGTLTLITSGSPTLEDNGLFMRGPTVRRDGSVEDVLVGMLAHWRSMMAPATRSDDEAALDELTRTFHRLLLGAVETFDPGWRWAFVSLDGDNGLRIWCSDDADDFLGTWFRERRAGGSGIISPALAAAFRRAMGDLPFVLDGIDRTHATIDVLPHVEVGRPPTISIRDDVDAVSRLRTIRALPVGARLC